MTGLEQTAPEKEKQPVEMPDDEVLYELADLFRVFGDSTRIKILYALHDSELCVRGRRAAEPVCRQPPAAGAQGLQAGALPAGRQNCFLRTGR